MMPVLPYTGLDGRYKYLQHLEHSVGTREAGQYQVYDCGSTDQSD